MEHEIRFNRTCFLCALFFDVVLRRKYSLWGIYKKKSQERESLLVILWCLCLGKQTVGLELFGHEMNFFASFALKDFFVCLHKEMKTVLSKK